MLRSLAGLSASLVTVTAVAFGAVYIGTAQETAALASSPAAYPGAAALSAGASVPPVKFFAPPLANVQWDVPTGTRKCRLSFDETEPVPCLFGDRNGRFKVFLIGDSHAEHWVPAFEEVAAARGWNAASYTKSSCPLFPDMVLRKGKPYDECLAWGRRMLQVIDREKPDLVILTAKKDMKAEADKPIAPSLVRLWREIEALGPKVVVLADTPEWGVRPDECLARDPSCSVAYASIAQADPLVAAHDLYPHVPLIDFTDMVCPDGRCPAVIGNVVVWRDRHHLTATYARSMADVFGKRLDVAIAANRPGKRSPLAIFGE